MGLAMNLVAFLLCVTWTPAIVYACSPPVGWKTLPAEDRLKQADLILHVRYHNMTEQRRPGAISANDKEVMIHVEVLCILQNKKAETITPSMIIWESKPVWKCVNNFVSFNVGETAVVMLAKLSDTGRFEFRNINVQGASFNTTGNGNELAVSKESNLFKPTEVPGQHKCHEGFTNTAAHGAMTSSVYVLFFGALLAFMALRTSA